MLADASGLSAAHVNRVLRKLRDTGRMTLQGGTVTFDSLGGLVRLADFDRADLYFDRPLMA